MTWNVKRNLNRLHDDSITGVIGTADVLALTEIGMLPHDPTPYIPGYTCVSYAPRPGGAHTSRSGGVACYVRDTIYAHARSVCSHPDQGISIISVHAPGHRKVFIACCYLPHADSNALLPGEHDNTVRATASARATARDEWFNTLQDGINACGDGDLVVVGDFNARTAHTSEIDDFVWDDTHEAGIPIPDPLLHYSNQVQALPQRSSMDGRLNPWGQALLGFCAEQRLVILNGRVAGDEVGSFTYRGHTGGHSVIDYVISTPDLCMDPATRLHVWDFDQLPDIPGLTRFDHAPVSITMRLKSQAQPRRARTQVTQGQACKQIKWHKEKQDQYVDTICQDRDVQIYLGRALAARTGEHSSRMLCKAVTLAVDQVMPARRAGRASGAQGDRSQHRCNAWFDVECKRLRALKLAAQDRDANSPEAKEAARVYWQRIRLVKRLAAEKAMDARIQEWYEEPRSFWKGFKGTQSAHGNFTLDDWSRYFEALFSRVTTHEFVGGSVTSHVEYHRSLFPEATAADLLAAECLNTRFTQDEVRDAMFKMKDRKAAGVDGLPAELFVYAFPEADEELHALLPVITRMFNLIFGGDYPRQWAECALIPVPKSKGDIQNQDDYRGIAVGTALSKLYSTVMLMRADAWAEREGKRARGQAGFRYDRGTSDNVFIVQHVLELAKSRRKTTYAAFIDFRKAYDSINRDLLWKALASMGVHGEFLHSLQQMYSNVGMRVRVDGQLGKLFKADVGVKQGDPLSPLLFGLFIDRFEKFLADRCPHAGVGKLGEAMLQCLLYADDLVLLAESASQLQEMLDCLHEFADANHMSVNTSKSKVVIFNNIIDKWQGDMLYAGTALPIVPSFVYLGTRFYSNCNMRGDISKNMASNLVKAKAAMNAMKQRCRELGMHNIMVQCDLFNVLVASILNFGSEMWGVYHMEDMPKNNCDWGAKCEAEMLHRIFLRSIFQVRTRSSGPPLMNEARRSPIMHSWFKLAIGWWNRIIAREDGDIVKQALTENMQMLAFDGQGPGHQPTVPCWGRAFYNMMSNLLPSMVDGQQLHSMSKIKVKMVAERLHDTWHDRVWGVWAKEPTHPVPVRSIPEAESVNFKLATYRSWFCQASLEPGEGFAYHVNTLDQIKALATFRMSSHDLNIERMRYAPHRRARPLRLCQCCEAGAREDEMHVLECEAYVDIRANFADVFAVPNDTNPDTYMLKVMNPEHTHAWRRLANFIINVLARRKSIIDSLA